MDAVCDAGGDITVIDPLIPFLDGCQWAVSMGGIGSLPGDVRDCNTPAFREPCLYLKHSLNLVFGQGDMSKPMEFPQMSYYLKRLGLDKVTEIDGTLKIHNIGTSEDPRLPFTTDAFLPELQRVSIILLRDDNPTRAGLPPLLSGLGMGFGNVQQLDLLSISGQGFKNLQEFSGLKCAATGIAIINNPLLATLGGLQALDVIGYDGGPGTKLVISDNPMLTQGSDLAALSRVAGCLGSAGGNPRDPIFVAVPPCANPIVTWAMLCGYLTAGTCPPQPPPPSPPPLPPSPSPPPAPAPLCPLPPLAGDLAPGEEPVVCVTTDLLSNTRLSASS